MICDLEVTDHEDMHGDYKLLIYEFEVVLDLQKHYNKGTVTLIPNSRHW